MSRTNDASPDKNDTHGRLPQAPVRYTEHLVCQLEEENPGWQHLYRLDLQRPGAEFVGGQGGRIATLQSHTMGVSADWVSMTFDPSSQSKDQSVGLKTFQVHIHRSTLVYRWFWGAGQSQQPPAGTPDMQGRCALLDAKHLVAYPTA